MTEQSATSTGEKQSSWWALLLWGVAALAAAVFIFDYLSDKEQAGESFRINWIFAIIYQVLGKWGVCGVFAVIGLGCFVGSARRFRR